MSDELRRKAAVLQYIDCLNDRNVEGAMGFFAPDAVFEDPVGLEDDDHPARGIDAILEHGLRTLKEYSPTFEPGTPSTSFGAQFVVLPTVCSMELGASGMRGRVNVVQLYEFDDQDRFRSVRAFWGTTDIDVVENV